jgi:hypothetical protein
VTTAAFWDMKRAIAVDIMEKGIRINSYVYVVTPQPFQRHMKRAQQRQNEPLLLHKNSEGRSVCEQQRPSRNCAEL